MNSALNQPLNAEIPLLSATAEDLAALTVRISSQTFEGLGVTDAGFGYSIESRNSRNYIKITSRQPIREPLLNFLIEVEWPKGRLLREFAVLLNPPSFVNATQTEPAPPAVPPTPQKPPSQRTRPPSSSTPAPAAITRPVAEPEPPPPPAAEENTASTNSAATQFSGTYGPVRRGETLWKIAERVRPGPSISVPRMMRALLEGNRNAFARNDIDTLMAGTTLRIPVFDGVAPADQVQSLSPVEPTPETEPQPVEETVMLQPETDEAPAMETTPGMDVTQSPVSEQAGAEVRLLPPDPTDQTALASDSRIRLGSDDRLNLSLVDYSVLSDRIKEVAASNPDSLSPDDTPAGDNMNISMPTPEVNPESAQEPSETTTTAAMDAAVMTGGEKELSDVNEMAADQNEELMNPDSSSTEEMIEPDSSATDPVMPETDILQETGQSGLSTDEQTSLSEETTETDVAPDSSDEASTSSAIGADTDPDTDVAANQDSSAGTLDIQTDTSQGFVSDPVATTNEGDWVTTLINFTEAPLAALGDLPSSFDDPVMLPAIGGGVVLLLLLLWLLMRRRSGGSGDAEENDDLAFEPIVQFSPSEERERIPAKSLRENATEETTQIEPPRPFRPAANPLERVDLLLAVGNYREAENVARLALADDPDNIVLLAKMLDIHFAAGNAEKFQEDAETLRNHIDDEDHPLWQHSLDMGRQLCPDYPLFGASDADTMVLTTALDDSAVITEEREADDDDRDAYQTSGIESSVLRAHDRSEGFHPGSLSAEEDNMDDDDEDATIVMGNIASHDRIESEAESAPPVKTDNILEFDSEFNFSDPADSTEEDEFNKAADNRAVSDDETIADGFASLDFDFEGLDELKQIDDDQDVVSSDRTDDDQNSTDFDFDSFLPAATSEEQTAHSEEDLQSEIQDLDFSFEEIPTEKEEVISDLDFGDFDIDSITADESSSSVIIDDNTLIDSSDSVETKLELAAAYLDMDDADGARSLLEEVMGEGDSGQKKRAQDMLERLAT